MVRVPVLDTGGRRFESDRPDKDILRNIGVTANILRCLRGAKGSIPLYSATLLSRLPPA